MHEQLTAFQRALVDSVLKGYADVPDEKELPNAFSEGFKNWAKTFQKRNGFKRRRTIAVLKRILIAALIALLLAGAAMAIPAVRERVIDFFFEKDDIQIGITFDPKQAATAPKEVEKPYTITYIPDDFELVLEGYDRGSAYLRLTNENDLWVTLIQLPIPENSPKDCWWGYDAEESKHRTVLMGDYLVEIIYGNENYKLVWTNNEYIFTLELPYSIDESEMQKIFASWGPKE